MSLIEIIVATSILSVVLLSMIYGMVLAMRLQENSRLRDRAMADLESVREIMLSAPFEDIKTIYPEGSTIAAFNNVPGEIITINYPNANLNVDPMRINITVQWRTKVNALQTMTLQLLRKK